MLKKITFKQSAWICMVLLLTLCAVPASAAELIPPASSDYFLNMNFTAAPASGSAWHGGGLAAEAVSGTWARNSSVAYDDTNQALKMSGWMESVLDSPITAQGKYVFEIDVLAPDGLAFHKEGKTDVYQFAVYSSSGALFRPIEINDGGAVSIAGKATGKKIETNKWYTLRGVFSLPAGQMGEGAVIDKATGEIVARGTGQSNVTDIKKPLRCSFKTGVTDNLYTQNWRFYKNDIGTAEPIVNPMPPHNEADYYINSTPATASEKWTGGAAGDTVSGNYKGSAQYSAEKDVWSAVGGQYIQAEITAPALPSDLLAALSAAGVTGVPAGLLSGTYGMEMDFMVEALSGTAKNIDMFTAVAIQNNPSVQRTALTFLAVDAKTGEIKLFTTRAGTPVNTGKNVVPNNWYTVKVLFDLDAQRAEVTVLDKGTGGVIVSGKSDVSGYAYTPLYCVNRVVNGSDVPVNIKGFKFYRNSTAFGIPTAVFKNTAGEKIESAQPGDKVTVVPTIANTTGTAMNCTFITALYKSDETLVNADIREYSIAGNNVIWTPNAQPVMEIPNDGGSYTVKCYLWDSMNRLLPLAAPAELPPAVV